MTATAARMEKSCAKKLRHPNEELALMALRSLKGSTNAKRKTMLCVYPCRFGNHWHIGHNRRRKR